MSHACTLNPFMPLPISDWSEKHLTADQALSSNKPLTGMRLAVKDLFHMAGLPTSAGNPSWLATHPVPTKTASSVARLLAHGAQFCGKTITDELAYSLNGQNQHYGTPCNPITPERLPGGSSSGSAVAVAAGLADIGLGTDTGGSIRVPASYQGLFGLRPTHGVVAADGLVPLAPAFDTVGWLTRQLNQLIAVADVMLPSSTSLQEVSQTPPAQDNLFKSNPAKSHLSEDKVETDAITQILLATDLLQLCEHAEQIQTLLQQWLTPERQKAAGLKVSKITIAPEDWQLSETFRVLQGWQIKQQHGDWLKQTRPLISADIQARFDWSLQLTVQQYEEAAVQSQRFCQWLLPQLTDSVLILPTTPGRAPLLTTPANELADYRLQLMNLTAIAGLAGLPQLHLPLFTLDGAPCGLSLIGSRHSDKKLLMLAQDFLSQQALAKQGAQLVGNVRAGGII